MKKIKNNENINNNKTVTVRTVRTITRSAAIGTTTNFTKLQEIRSSNRTKTIKERTTRTSITTK
jgi:hypothetical protein